MSVSQPNPSVSQGVCGGDGGAGSTSNWLNTVGKWGTVLTATLQGKPVASNASGVSIGAKGSTTLPGKISSNSMILILIIVVGLIFLAMRK